MALPSLINGAECGPINPLQTLSKQFDKDRGAQQDHFGRGRAGPSREVFHTAASIPRELNQEATQFFSNTPSLGPQHVVSNRFDLSSLQANLPSTQLISTNHLQPSSWAADFLTQPLHKGQQVEIGPSSQSPHFSSVTRYGPSENNYTMSAMLNRPAYPIPIPAYSQLSRAPTTFQRESDILPEYFPPEEQASQKRQLPLPPDADELSKTAGLLLETVKDEMNPKFKKSAFLELMRQFRDREAVIQGTDIVEAMPFENLHNIIQDVPETDVKGKGREVVWADAFQSSFQSPRDRHISGSRSINSTLPPSSLSVRKSVHFDQSQSVEGGPSGAQQPIESQESEDDWYWQQENADYQNYWNIPPSAQDHYSNHEWDKLQMDWDRFEATSSGIKPVPLYQFQRNNPYLSETASTTKTHRLHSDENSNYESVLEIEAAVQMDMQNAVAWYQLGVKQQENEREQSAILALRRAVELTPSYLEAWLALAISHTNEGDKRSADNAIEQWVRNNERYDGDKLLGTLEPTEKSDQTEVERNYGLVQVLMNLIRQSPQGEVDADLQTALGVLLNTNEDYDKAHDCFRTALSVRPDDWLLYNRVGATLANSGKASDAVWYYHRALALNPSYIRARFNLGISCINMKRFDEAAHHILDALVLQENDMMNDEDTRGITSSTLWECLRTTCMQLQRPDLAVLCDSRDLETFRKAFLKG